MQQAGTQLGSGLTTARVTFHQLHPANRETCSAAGATGEHTGVAASRGPHQSRPYHTVFCMLQQHPAAAALLHCSLAEAPCVAVRQLAGCWPVRLAWVRPKVQQQLVEARRPAAAALGGTGSRHSMQTA
jgi:hypothetical protein